MGSPCFRFKQFTVWHDRCAMKVGTDGVLLGAWCPLMEFRSSYLTSFERLFASECSGVQEFSRFRGPTDGTDFHGLEWIKSPSPCGQKSYQSYLEGSLASKIIRFSETNYHCSSYRLERYSCAESYECSGKHSYYQVVADDTCFY